MESLIFRPFAIAIVVLTLGAGAAAAHADHPHAAPPPAIPFPAQAPPLLEKGDWRLIHNEALAPASTGWNAVDWDDFERDGRRYVVGASMGVGLTILDVTDPTVPVKVGEYGAPGCPVGGARFAADLATDGFEMPAPFAPPLTVAWGTSGIPSAWQNDLAITPDGRLALLGTDTGGRCHDPVWGGVEIVDLSDVARPRLLHLVRTWGMAHSVTVDPAHPTLAYLSTSDGESYIDVLDLASCLDGVHACAPDLARVAFEPGWAEPLTPNPPGFFQGAAGCHDVRVTGLRLACAAIGATLVFDTTHVLDATGRVTGARLTDPALAGACTREPADPLVAPGIIVTDCRAWTEEAFVEAGLESARLRLVSSVRHGGFGTPLPADEDIQLSHQAEIFADGRAMLVTDERGGGTSYPCPGGGVWFYDLSHESTPRVFERADGSPAVFLIEDTPTAGTCSAHYGAPVHGEDLVVMGWYTAGTRVIRYSIDDESGTMEFEEVAAYIPAGATTWSAMPLGRNPHDPDELLILTADARGFDLLGVRIPADDDDEATASGEGVAAFSALGVVIGTVVAPRARRMVGA